MARKHFVLGWYGHNNLGDEAFKASFLQLWPGDTFTFGDKLPSDDSLYDDLLIGGGSFMDHAQPRLKDWTKPIGFVGVGISGGVHPDYDGALKRAFIIVARNSKAKEFYPEAIVAPDLVFAQDIKPISEDRPSSNKVVIIMNDFVSPRFSSPSWHVTAFEWFCHEFGQTCQILREKKKELHFFPMGLGTWDDSRTAAAVIGRLKRPELVKWYTEGKDDLSDGALRKLVSEADLVITQRFHGIVYAIQAGCPFITITHHDKLIQLTKDLRWPGLVNYYGYHRQYFFDALKAIEEVSPKSLINYSENAKREWQCISATVAKRFSG